MGFYSFAWGAVGVFLTPTENDKNCGGGVMFTVRFVSSINYNPLEVDASVNINDTNYWMFLEKAYFSAVVLVLS